MTTCIDHQAAVLKTAARVDDARAELDAAITARNDAIREARHAGVTIYRIAQWLGLRDNAVRHALGINPPRRKASNT